MANIGNSFMARLKKEKEFIDKLNEELLKASKKGNANKVDYLIKLGAEVDVRGDYGQTPLLIALIYEKNLVARVLLENGADFRLKDVFGRNAIIYGAKCKDIELMKKFIKTKEDVNVEDELGFCPLWMAVLGGDSKMVEYLIEKGADIKVKSVAGITPLGIAIKNNDCEMVRVLIRNGSGFKFFNVKEKEFFLTADDSVRRVVFEEIKKQNKVLKFFMKNDLVASR